MKKFLLPVALICFTMFCLIFVHIDNMNKLNNEDVTLEMQDSNIYYQPTLQ